MFIYLTAWHIWNYMVDYGIVPMNAIDINLVKIVVKERKVAILFYTVDSGIKNSRLEILVYWCNGNEKT